MRDRETWKQVAGMGGGLREEEGGRDRERLEEMQRITHRKRERKREEERERIGILQPQNVYSRTIILNDSNK